MRFRTAFVRHLRWPPSLALVVAAVAVPARAAPARCTNGEQSALVELGCELQQGLGTATAGTTVAVGRVTSDRAVSREDELRRRFAAAVGGATEPGASTLAQARALAAKATRVVFATLEIHGGEVRATADAYPVTHGFWDRLRDPEPAATAHAFGERRLDAEIASFLPPVPLVARVTERASDPTSDVVALACGDVDGDGALELVTMGRREIEMGRVRAGHFVATASVAWPALSPVAASPLREPLGSIEIETGHGVRVGLTDRAAGHRLSSSLSPEAELDGSLPFGPFGCLVRTGTAVGNAVPCTKGDATRAADFGTIDAFAWGTMLDGAGRVRTIVATRSEADGSVTLKDESGRTARVADAGAALAVGDLNLDGEPELVTSVDTLNPADDALVVSSWTSDGNVKERLRIPVPEGIRAIAACPPEDAGLSAIAVATGNGLWIVR